jgi:hypothetical protein
MRRHLAPLQRRGGERGRAKLAGKRVRIWSGQWGLWWRSGANGYTSSPAAAGIYTFEEAWACTSHCGPEKRIAFEVQP